MSVFLSIDSSSQNSNSSNDFTTNYAGGINVSDGQYEIALVKSNLWYSWANISAEQGNNTIRYYSVYNIPGFRPLITFPDGQYTIDDINDYLKRQMDANNDFIVLPSGVREYPIIISPNYSTLKVDITLVVGFQLDFTTSFLCLLLGWTQQIVTVSGSGTSIANINNSINSLIIHCSIVSSSYKNGSNSDYIWSFIPNTPPGSNIEIEVRNLIYLPIYEPSRISTIRMYITDQLERTINFRGEPVTYILHLRRINNINNSFNDPYNK